MKMCFLQFGVLAKIQQQKQKKLIGISIAFFSEGDIICTDEFQFYSTHNNFSNMIVTIIVIFC